MWSRGIIAVEALVVQLRAVRDHDAKRPTSRVEQIQCLWEGLESGDALGAIVVEDGELAWVCIVWVCGEGGSVGSSHCFSFSRKGWGWWLCGAGEVRFRGWCSAARRCVATKEEKFRELVFPGRRLEHRW